jgi:hypothetical protein
MFEPLERRQLRLRLVPTIRKRPGHSGYATMAAGVTDRFAQDGPWTVDELQEMSAATIARAVDRRPRSRNLAY